MMPLVNEQADRPGCVPSSKDETFLPSINGTPKVEKSSKNINHNTPSSNKNSSLQTNNNNNGVPNNNSYNNQLINKNNNNNNNNNNIENKLRERHSFNGFKASDSYNAALKPYSSAPASETSTPFKLPTIDRSESNSVTCLVGDGHVMKGKSRSWDRRSRMCRSPSCPSLGYWGDHPESPRSTRLNDSFEHNDIHGRHFFSHRDDDPIKLPSIHHSRKTTNTSFTLTSSTANSSTHTSRDTSPFHFKREATFLNLLHNEHSSDKQNFHSSSPPHNFSNGEQMSRSSTQSSALLLPISCHDPHNAAKSKRKRKKQNSIMVSSEDGSEAEKLLREKLGAIERRDFDLPSPRRHNDNEKTDLSDTAFIEKVQDETNLANGASETLTTKPPKYQNTPTRIKTEKKVAPVKA